MRKIVIIILVAAIVAIAAAVWFFPRTAPGVTGSGGSNTSATVTLPPYTPPLPPPTSTAITIGTPRGGITTNNFYRTAKMVTADGTGVLILQTNAYMISYYTPDSSFNILVTEAPYDTYRSQAEAAFLSALNISQADACKLRVKVGSTFAVDATHAGTNEGLSFCPGGL